MSNDKMIYDDAKSIGVDEQSLNKFDLLFNDCSSTPIDLASS